MNQPERMMHDDASRLLPWFANGTLTAAEGRQVEAHVRDCVACRRELNELTTLRDALQEGNGSVPRPDMRRVNARIDARRRSRLRHVLEAMVGNPVRVAVLAQSVAVLALAVVLVWPVVTPKHYRTLTDSSALPAGFYVRTVFAPDLSSAELERLLGDLGVRIAAGPSARGVYTLQPVAETAADDQLLLELRSRSEVLFAEPIRIGEPPP